MCPSIPPDYELPPHERYEERLNTLPGCALAAMLLILGFLIYLALTATP